MRIFERPYYSLCFDPPLEDFRTLESAFFFVIMTMASAGFGDITTSTRVGRWLTLSVACWGAIMLSLLFTIIGNIFYLDDHSLAPLFLVGETKVAGRAVLAALHYNAIKRRRYRLLEEGVTTNVPSTAELKAAKFGMERALRDYRGECVHNLDLDSASRRDRELQTVKDEVLDLSDKFDFFIASLLRSGLIKS